MAHDIDMTTGSAAIAWSFRTPWHGLGRQMTEIERSSLSDAMRVAGVDFDVRTAILTDDTGRRVSDAQGIIRTDTGAYLGTVGAGYTPIQNGEAFATIDALIQQGCRIEVMGALSGGRRVFALLRMPDTATVTIETGDDVRGYLLVSAAHDGSGAVNITLTPVRVVCRNTMTRAFASAHATAASIRHTKSAPERLELAARTLTNLSAALTETGETFRALAARRMGPAAIAAYIEAVIPNPTPKEPLSTILRARREAIADLVFHGAGHVHVDVASGEASAWYAYNAVTEYFDHVRPREAGSVATAVKAADSALFGANAGVKARAFTLARDLVTA